MRKSSQKNKFKRVVLRKTFLWISVIGALLFASILLAYGLGLKTPGEMQKLAINPSLSV